jgi:hypothetical protein
MHVRLAYVFASTLPLLAVACGSKGAAPPHTPATARSEAVVVVGQDRARTVPYAPAGTAFNASLDQAVDTRLSSPGQAVTATLMQPILALNGDVLVPEGAQLRGRIESIYHEPFPRIVLSFDSLALREGVVPVGVSVVAAQESRYRTLPSPPGVTSLQAGTQTPEASPTPSSGVQQVSMAKGSALKLSLTTPIVNGKDLH